MLYHAILYYTILVQVLALALVLVLLPRLTDQRLGQRIDQLAQVAGRGERAAAAAGLEPRLLLVLLFALISLLSLLLLCSNGISLCDFRCVMFCPEGLEPPYARERAAVAATP